jgi:hypothetical protein
MAGTARCPSDLDHIHDLTLTLLQHGADPNFDLASSTDPSSQSRGTTQEPTICHSQVLQKYKLKKS